MRGANLRCRNINKPNKPLSKLRFAALFAGLSIAGVMLSGCGGSGGDTSAPIVSQPTVVTNPVLMTYLGGTATISTTVTDSTGVDSSKVLIDIVGPGGTSVIGGPQVMTKASSPANTYTYQITLPNNLTGVTANTYTASINATDTLGNTTRTPVTTTIVVPSPPSAPVGP